jgi:uncharacterized Ntn-hydrolase superfamily protein
LRIGSLLLALAASSCASATQPEYGTWSIAAVDRETGQVGLAGASCTSNVQGIGTIVPGVGVVIVQGMSNRDARALGVERFAPQEQQYAVVVLDAERAPASFIGETTDGWHGSASADGVTVQGNCLVGEAVVERTLATFQSTQVA